MEVPHHSACRQNSNRHPNRPPLLAVTNTPISRHRGTFYSTQVFFQQPPEAITMGPMATLTTQAFSVTYEMTQNGGGWSLTWTTTPFARWCLPPCPNKPILNGSRTIPVEPQW